MPFNHIPWTSFDASTTSMKNIPVRRIPSTQTEPQFTENFTIRDLKEVLAGKDMVQELHRHDYFFILAVEKGKGKHEIDFIPFPVKDHVVFILRPGQVHQLTLKAGSTGYLVQCQPEFLSLFDKTSIQLLRKASSNNLCQVNAKSFHRLLSPLSSIFKEYTDRKEGYQEIIKANLAIFMIELVRNRQHRTIPTAPVPPYPQERFEELTGLLEKDIFNHKQVAYYAEQLHLSPYQLNAITKAAAGKTCSELINEQIILEARRYLLATSNQVNEIAFHLGYEDVSYFIRFFKKHTGHSPASFRQAFQ